jgi:hypothetical protein
MNVTEALAPKHPPPMNIGQFSASCLFCPGRE